MRMRVSLSLFAAGLCAPMLSIALGSSVNASCGDWLAEDGSRQHFRITSSMSTGDAQHLVGHRLTPDDLPLRVPCHGPHCRQTPLQPPLPLPNSSTLSIEKTLLVSAIHSILEFDPRATVLVIPSARPLAGYLSLPEHPPRVS